MLGHVIADQCLLILIRIVEHLVAQPDVQVVEILRVHVKVRFRLGEIGNHACVAIVSQIGRDGVHHRLDARRFEVRALEDAHVPVVPEGDVRADRLPPVKLLLARGIEGTGDRTIAIASRV